MSKVRIKNHAPKRNKELGKGTRANVRAAAEHLQGELQKTLRRGGRSGETYRVQPGSSRTYTASAPGEPPAVRTGRLASSITLTPNGLRRILVGSPLVYARHLEFGTKHMRPRPWFRKTAREQRQAIKRILNSPLMGG